MAWDWSVWRDHQKLHSCSLAARGLWAEMLSFMEGASPRGHLRHKGEPLTLTKLAEATSVSWKQIPSLVAELEAAGVFRRGFDGSIACPEMQEEPSLVLTPEKPGTPADEMVRVWNTVMKGVLPAVKFLSVPRHTAAMLRFKDTFGSSIGQWQRYCETIRNSSFLTGRDPNSGRSWKANLDWVLKPANVAKILEGFYDRENDDHLPTVSAYESRLKAWLMGGKKGPKPQP